MVYRSGLTLFYELVKFIEISGDNRKSNGHRHCFELRKAASRKFVFGQ